MCPSGKIKENLSVKKSFLENENVEKFNLIIIEKNKFLQIQ
jgi:hypothetical protein